MSMDVEHLAISHESELPALRKLFQDPNFLHEVITAPRGEVDTYGATPLDRLLTLEQQARLKSDLKNLTYHVPEGIPLQIADHVHTTFGDRFDARGGANDENFVTSLMFDHIEELDPIYQEMVQKARLGHASPAELIIVRNVMGIRSAELACLTHPYGEEKLTENIDEMRFAVEYAVSLLGGEWNAEAEAEINFKHSVGSSDDIEFDPEIGFVMTRKRTYGTLPDGTIIRERSSFILRSDTDSQLKTLFGKELLGIQKDDPDWRHKLAEIPGLKEYILHLLKDDVYTEAVPISSTIYAFNRETAKLVAEHVEKQKLAKANEIEEYPEEFAEYHGLADMDNEDVKKFHQEMEQKISEQRELFNRMMPIFNVPDPRTLGLDPEEEI